MRWRKLGRIFCSDGQRPWMMTHASVPVAERIDGDLYRVYFTSRDASNRSHVGWLEIDIARPDTVLRLAERPLLAPGQPGDFDDAGTMLSSILIHNGRRYVYYTGWSLRTSVPYHMAIGLAIGDASTSDPVVERLPGPIIDRSVVDPKFCASPCVRLEGQLWRMWYVSGLGWVLDGGRTVPVYNMRYATSSNGRDWTRSGRVALDPVKEEFGFSRASVLSRDGSYEMWYSVRGRNRAYRPQFASSADGLSWVRNTGDVGLSVSESGWDSEMITYPYCFDHGTSRYLLYCGNEYGKDGVGLAILD